MKKNLIMGGLILFAFANLILFYLMAFGVIEPKHTKELVVLGIVSIMLCFLYLPIANMIEEE